MYWLKLVFLGEGQLTMYVHLAFIICKWGQLASLFWTGAGLQATPSEKGVLSASYGDGHPLCASARNSRLIRELSLKWENKGKGKDSKEYTEFIPNLPYIATQFHHIVPKLRRCTQSL